MQKAGYLADGKKVIVVYTDDRCTGYREQVILTCATYEDACKIARQYNEEPAHDQN